MVNIVVRQDFGLKFLAKAKPLRPSLKGHGLTSLVIPRPPGNLQVQPRQAMSVVYLAGTEVFFSEDHND